MKRILMDGGSRAQYDLMSRSVKAQMKYADKIGAKCTVVIGDSELEENRVTVKNMKNGEQAAVALDTLNSEWLKEFAK